MMHKGKLRICLVLGTILALSACKPPASDDESLRGPSADRWTGPSTPIDSPESEGAIWTAGEGSARIIYGRPGSPPDLALACEQPGPNGQIRITRYAPADEGAGAFLALVGNSHIARIEVDAIWNGRAWIWEGIISAHSPNLEVLTGRRAATATIPGAGEVTINPSQAPAQLITDCRGGAFPRVQ